MNAEQYYQQHVLLHAQGSLRREARDLRELPPVPSETDYALFWLTQENRRGTILDVGCGPLGLLASAEGWFTERHGFDIARCPSWDEQPQIQALVGNLDAGPLPYPDERFDAVTCLMVVEHVFDPFHAVRELRRVCKPGGRIVIGVPNLAGLKRRLDLLVGKFPVTSARHSFAEGSWDGFHLHNFTQTSLDWLLRKEGLEPLRWAAQGRLRILKQWRPSLFGNDLIVLARKVAPEPHRPFPN
ncbi:MAG: class I SAM-dependent methyltransferase [Verrucomicrobiales bacterium]|nr:class I SAM-dependent methyltransferase [Verrucomicrobiales bacterium]